MKNYIVLFTILFFHVDQWMSAQQQQGDAWKYAETIQKSELQEMLTVLASDSFEGRETGMKGQRMAASYLANYYEQHGQKPCVEGSWFQTFPLKKQGYQGSIVTDGNKTYAFADDFYFFSDTDAEIQTSDFVFAGYGISDTRYSDYKKIDVKGKTVICFLGEPMNKKGMSVITGDYQESDWSSDWGELKIQAAAERGAKAILFVNMNYDEYMLRIRYWLEQAPMRLDRGVHEEVSEDAAPIPYAFISPRLANILLAPSGNTCEKLAQRIQSKKKTQTVQGNGSMVFHMKRSEEAFQSDNVLCYIEGSDPVLKNEIVVISAHYDHVGIIKGEVHNGADDDGSGTVSAMEIAEAFIQAKNEGKGPRRSILILHVSGEEKGLLGSEWYTYEPVFPLKNTVCDLNIDMIGRMDEDHTDKNYVYLIGSDKLSKTLHKISEQCNTKYTRLKLDYTYNSEDDPNRFYYRSDHYNFAKNNIPVIFYFSGVHEDYHKPGDDAHKILYDKMETIARLVFCTAWDVANRDQRLPLD
ncbi:MAG: M28 family peptidase [Flavobacteriales bacterium]